MMIYGMIYNSKTFCSLLRSLVLISGSKVFSQKHMGHPEPNFNGASRAARRTAPRGRRGAAAPATAWPRRATSRWGRGRRVDVPSLEPLGHLELEKKMLVWGMLGPNSTGTEGKKLEFFVAKRQFSEFVLQA